MICNVSLYFVRGREPEDVGSPRNGLLLMSIGRSYHTRTIIQNPKP
jgi:hypothetical protein